MNGIQAAVRPLSRRNPLVVVPLWRNYGVGNPFLDNIKRTPQDLKNQFKAKQNLIDQNLTRAMMEAEDRRDASHKLSRYFTSGDEIKGNASKNAPKSNRGANSA